MGLRAYTPEPAKYAHGVIAKPEERYRKERARRRVLIYQDNVEGVLEREVAAIFQTVEVRAALSPFLRLAGANSLQKRIVDEIARPIYATAPQRHILAGPGSTEDRASEDALKGIAEESYLDRVMDETTRLTINSNHTFLLVRYIRDQGMCVDLMTPDMVSVIPNPARPCGDALAVIYDKPAIDGSIHYVVWDDTEYFEMTADGALVASPVPGAPGEFTDFVQHGLGIIPIVQIRRRVGWGSYWDSTTGNDLEAATLQVMLINALVLKLHKSQGFKTLWGKTTDGATPKGIILDEEGVITGFDELATIDFVTDPAHYLKTKDSIETTIAANYGISRERLNQATTAGGSDEAALRERTAEIVAVMRVAERDLFDVLKVVSQQHPTYRIARDARMAIDFGELHHRTDRKTQLDIWDTEERQGLRSIIDSILQDNPEFDREQAWDFFRRNLEDRSKKIDMLRALNMSADANADIPGQNPQQQGALGPGVRDGKITGDQAAVLATGMGAPKDLRAIAMRVLKGGKSGA